MAGRDQLLERAAIVDPVARRYLDLVADALLQVRHETAQITPADIGGDDDAALAILAVDLVRPQRRLDLRNFAQRYRLWRARHPRGGAAGLVDVFAAAQRDRQILQRRRVLAQVLGQANDDVEAAIALEQLACDFAAHGSRHGVLHGAGIEAITHQRLPVRCHRQQRQTRGLFEFDVGRTGHGLGNFLDASAHRQQ